MPGYHSVPFGEYSYLALVNLVRLNFFARIFFISSQLNHRHRFGAVVWSSWAWGTRKVLPFLQFPLEFLCVASRRL